jgi:2-polyprenyl-3-methyl-5-hydroxy-6-metoxy-1,4-benzoquinol methylase
MCSCVTAFFLNALPIRTAGIILFRSFKGEKSRADILKEIVQSGEFRDLQSKYSPFRLPSLREIRPEQYQLCKQYQKNDAALAFRIVSPADFDWLEEMILKHGYYDNVGSWGTEIDDDKKGIAQMAQLLLPERSLELGCFNGSVVKLMREAGIDAEGVEISHLALSLAHRAIRSKIHFGDIRQIDLELNYDLILAMDLFEHLNPNTLNQYILRCRELLGKGGYVLTNIPAYGFDSVFGEAHALVFDDWKSCVGSTGMFPTLHVDRDGWPICGHLIWAETGWWQQQFEAQGFRREIDIEKALHHRFDHFIVAKTPARKSFYLFSVGTPEKAPQDILSHIHSALIHFSA